MNKAAAAKDFIFIPWVAADYFIIASTKHPYRM